MKIGFVLCWPPLHCPLGRALVPEAVEVARALSNYLAWCGTKYQRLASGVMGSFNLSARLAATD